MCEGVKIEQIRNDVYHRRAQSDAWVVSGH